MIIDFDTLLQSLTKNAIQSYYVAYFGLWASFDNYTL